ncbi:calcium-binding protein [uncultured Aliiroseovarius sp.]|uniref:calcium-binding protein n=1 Tax=uncultured Aliiroseovarius sp. TaxID=1658783 RepID=UPI0025927D8C|nr:calcium-binding protein [uncultured Aliiroseovarius sp.]
MANLVLSNTHASVGLNHVDNVSDLEIFWQNGFAHLYASTGAYGGATVFDLSSTGECSMQAQTAYPASMLVSPRVQIELLEVDGVSYFLPFGTYDWQLSGFEVDTAGGLGASQEFTWGPGGLGGLSALVSSVQDGLTHVYAANAQSTGFNHYVVDDENRFQLIDSVGQPVITNSVDLVDLEIVTIESANILLAVSQDQVGISSYLLDGNGTPSEADALSAAEFLPISTPTALASGQVLDKTFAVIASAGTSSLTVVEIHSDGTMDAIDHIIDNTWTRFSGITEIAAAQAGENLYIVGAGADDGLSLFTLLPNGNLVHLDTVWDTHQTALQNVSALAMEYVGGKLQIFATSETERGITQFEYDLGPAGATLLGDGTNHFLQGTGGNDQIDGGIWSEALSGGDGDDILRDGIGEDILTGGAGADTFVLASDNMLDIITDFQAGVDKLNLSEFFMLYDASQLQVTSRSWGAEITFRNETTHVYSADGQPLDASHFTSFDTLMLDRPPNGFQFIPEIITGSEADDILQGDEGVETLFGLGGNDQFNWSPGADVFNGGQGIDTVSYHNASSSVAINLAKKQATGAADGDIHHSIENIVGTNWNDALVGDDFANSLFGGGGDDVLDGGMSGNILDGGDGSDTVTYANFRDAVVINLAQSTTSGAALGDILISIENIEGTAFDDTIIGNDGENTIWGGIGNDRLSGGAGDDVLFGGSGDDILSGGSGADVLDGGAGQDWVDYRQATERAIFYLGPIPRAVIAPQDTLISIEHAFGSAFDDQIHGSDVANTISGMAGADTIFGGGGNDRLTGDAGNDTLLGETGDDHLYGGAGDDTLNGGANRDRLDGGAGDDLLLGGAGNDVLLGQTGDDIMDGGSGADILRGGPGADLMLDSGGPDQYFGGAGFDTVDYSAHNSSVRVDLGSGNGFGAASGDTFHSIEGVIGGAGRDTIHGDSRSNTLSGLGHNDKLFGMGGHDTLLGGNGRDQLFGGSGRDRLFGESGPDKLYGQGGNDMLQGGGEPDLMDGGPGTDIANYADANASVTINLVSNRNKGAAFGDKLRAIEGIVGSSWDDHLTGNNRGNILRGGDGDDKLSALGGNDRVFGEDGNDKLIAGTGRDYFHGGSDTDTLVLSRLTSGAQVWLSLNKGGGSMQGDKIYSVENLVGTRFNDALHGDSEDNLLRGWRGDDILTGGAGNDQLYGDVGNDHLVGNTGDDELFGGDGNDILIGGRDNDILGGGEGADTFIFHSGADTIKDFESGADIIQLDATRLGVDASTLSNFAEYRDGGILLDFGDDNSLFIENTQSFSELQHAIVWL